MFCLKKWNSSKRLWEISKVEHKNNSFLHWSILIRKIRKVNHKLFLAYNIKNRTVYIEYQKNYLLHLFFNFLTEDECLLTLFRNDLGYHIANYWNRKMVLICIKITVYCNYSFFAHVNASFYFLLRNFILHAFCTLE